MAFKRPRRYGLLVITETYNIYFKEKNMAKEKIIALVEFSYVKELEIEADLDIDDVDKILQEQLEQSSNPLNEDYGNAEFINVSYKYADGTYSEWSEL